jgi:TRAP-type C4-dicarboxylate transport system substrate-binding protein
MRPRHHILAGACAVAALAAAAGCGDSAGADKTGAPAATEQVELVLASHDIGLESVQAWADAVEQLSEGSISVRITDSWRADEADGDVGLLNDVKAGKVQLARVTARAFDEVGVTSFQPLVAPMLIDSAGLEREVYTGDIGRRSLQGTSEAGLVGLAVLPTELRRPLGKDEPLLGVDDYAGKRMYTREGRIPEAALKALGATPVHRATGDWLDGTTAAEIGLSAIRGESEVARSAAGYTGNVVLWPQPIVFVMNQAAFDKLTPDQQAAVRGAGAAAYDKESKLESILRAEDLAISCRNGLKVFAASSDELAALHAAMEPVYAMIEKAPGNRAAVEQIRALKGGRTADAVNCENDTAAEETPEASASALEGTFRTSFTETQLRDSPLVMDAAEINDENWGELTLRLEDGKVRYEQRNDRAQFEMSGTYTTDGDLLTLDMTSTGETFEVRWQLYRGTLKLEREEGLGPSPTPLVLKPWERVG